MVQTRSPRCVEVDPLIASYYLPIDARGHGYLVYKKTSGRFHVVGNSKYWLLHWETMDTQYVNVNGGARVPVIAIPGNCPFQSSFISHKNDSTTSSPYHSWCDVGGIRTIRLDKPELEIYNTRLGPTNRVLCSLVLVLSFRIQVKGKRSTEGKEWSVKKLGVL